MKTKQRDREWFEQKVGELGEAVKRLPEDRREVFEEQLELFEESEGPEQEKPEGEAGER